MEGNRNSNSSANTERHFGGTVEDEEEEILKTRISCHPLYGLLVDSHLDCLKVGLGNIGDIDRSHRIDQKQAADRSSLSMFSRAELDQFMVVESIMLKTTTPQRACAYTEAYCRALKKLKEAMEEPHQDTMAFINGMHSQLEELTRTAPAPPEPAIMFSGDSKE